MDANVKTIMPRTRAGTEGKQRMAFVTRGWGDKETQVDDIRQRGERTTGSTGQHQSTEMSSTLFR